MFRQLKKWFSTPPDETAARSSARRTSVSATSANRAAPGFSGSTRRPDSESELVGDDFEFSIEDTGEYQGLGKNVLSPRKFYRVETGTFETLEIIDGPDDDDDDGIDPYNTGDFDRSGSWDKRFRR